MSRQTPKFSLVYVTCPSPVFAKKLAKDLLKKRLIACANILAGMTSVYRWNKKIQHAKETIAILKTHRANVPKVILEVSRIHPYETPCAIEIKIGKGNSSYFAWLAEESR